MLVRLVALISRQFFPTRPDLLLLGSWRDAAREVLVSWAERQASPCARVCHQRVRRQNAEGAESGAVFFNAVVMTWEPWRT
jgi:hypothetical protein